MRIIQRHIPNEASPAVADFYEQTITLNKPVYSQYDGFTQQFILNHERGHLALNTHSELEADAYAFKAVAGKQPYSLRKSIEALEKTLPFNTPEHVARYDMLVRQALEWDAAHGNEAAAAKLEEMDRYARWNYEPYQGSEWEDYQKAQLANLNSLALDTINEDFSLNSSTIALLGVFVVSIVVVAYTLRKK
jgi:hypothetical protein